MKRFFALIAALAALGLSACVSIVPRADCSGETESVASSVALKEEFDALARELCDDSCRTDPATGKRTCSGATVLVTDFVDIQSYKPKRSGVLFGELMRGSLNESCRYKIVQAEFADYFQLSEQGLTALTRNPQEVRHSEYPYAEAVVGTYHFSGGKVFLFARRLNASTGKIARIASREVPLFCSGADAVYHVE